MAKLLYGYGWRLMDFLRLQLKDTDFEQFPVIFREGKGEKDHPIMLPVSLGQPLKNQITFVYNQHKRDLAKVMSHLSCLLLACRNPTADKELGWPSLFPS